MINRILKKVLRRGRECRCRSPSYASDDIWRSGSHCSRHSFLDTLAVTARWLTHIHVLVPRTVGPTIGPVTAVTSGLLFLCLLAILPPPVHSPVPVPASLQVIVRQGDVGLNLGSPQLLSLESSSPQGPPEALSTSVSVVRPRLEFCVPPPVE